MTDPSDPTRLRDLDPLLREAFDTVRSEQPSTATVDAMVRAVEQATLGSALQGEPLSRSATKFALLKSGAAKLIVIAAISSGLLWALPSLRTPASDRALPAPASPGVPDPPASFKRGVPHAAQEPARSHDAATEAETTTEPSAPSKHDALTSERGRKVTRLRRRDSPRSFSAPSTSSAIDAPSVPRELVMDPAQKLDRSRTASEPSPAESEPALDELALLEEAQRALRTSPQRALELTAQHESEYPNGAYVQEREQIAIEALFGAGRIAAMRARAERFRRSFPGSAHNARITELLESRP